MTRQGLSTEDNACLVRLGLDRPRTFSERVTRMLVRAALEHAGSGRVVPDKQPA
jgi:hypothetical protein